MSDTIKKILKIVGISLVAVFGLIIIAMFVVDTDFSTARSVEIERPNEVVFDYIRHLRNHNDFTVWSDMDPDMEQEFRGTDGTVGFVWAWRGSEEVGSGEQEIVSITEDERIDLKLRFIEPFESSSDVYMITEALSENQTRVTWGFEGKMPRPMNLMLLFMDMEQLIGEDYETGLANLKTVLETEGDR